MTLIVSIAGSPSSPSRSLAVLSYANNYFATLGYDTQLINVRDLDPAELLHGRFDGATITPALELVAQAAGVLVATPIYKAAYTGVLKTFLDLLPSGALAGKIVLPIALGGAPAHMLVIDYALRPVLVALGASQTLAGVYLLDSQLEYADGQLTGFSAADVQTRLQDALDSLDRALRPSGQAAQGV